MALDTAVDPMAADMAAIGTIGVFALVGLLIISGTMVVLAGVRGDRGGNYRRLAEQATASQQETAEALGELRTTMSSLDGRMGEVERLMREVG